MSPPANAGCSVHEGEPLAGIVVTYAQCFRYRSVMIPSERSVAVGRGACVATDRTTRQRRIRPRDRRPPHRTRTARRMDDADHQSAQLPNRQEYKGWTGSISWMSSVVGAAAAIFLLRRGGWHPFAATTRHVTQRSEVLGLYKQIMRTAQSWPSLKRLAVIREIRTEFKGNAKEADPQKLERMLAEAYAGLKEMRWGVGEAARAKATPRSSRSAWPPGRDANGVDQWALDELGLGSSSTLADAKRAYRERAKACHPDSNSSTADAEAFKRLQRAWSHVEVTFRRAERGSKIRAASAAS